VLDLVAITGNLVSTSTDPAAARSAMSWRWRTVEELPTDIAIARSLPCDLTYDADPELPDGWLYLPSRMEEKWVIGYRGGRILLVRSWSGAVVATAEVHREGSRVHVTRLDLADDTLASFGDPVHTFDWLLRSHALGQVWPLPVSKEGAEILEAVPLSVYGPFGPIAVCAATTWAPPPPERPLRASSAIVIATLLGDRAKVASAASQGVPVSARSPMDGYTALHFAASRGDVEAVRQLLDLGADPDVLADRNASVLLTALVHRAPRALLDLLVAGGATVDVPNHRGFGPLHAAAEIDDPESVPWLVAQGANLETRTDHGHTPLHIAAALGHADALRALLDAGADRHALDNDGRDARALAVAEGKPRSIEALDAAAGPDGATGT
jgi:ankyrin repeat protein